MDESNDKVLNQLRISISGNRSTIMIGKAIIRLFGTPNYICLRISKRRDSMIIMPCDSKERLSFKVPENLYGKEGREFYITSKSFVTEVFKNNNLDFSKNYMIPGTYVEHENCVIFKIADAFEHMLNTEDISTES